MKSGRVRIAPKYAKWGKHHVPLAVLGVSHIVDLDFARLSIDLNDIPAAFVLFLRVEGSASHHHLDAVVFAVTHNTLLLQID